MKRALVLFFLMSIAVSAFSQNPTTQEGQSLFDEFWRLKMEITALEDDSAAMAIDEFLEENDARLKAIGAQERLALENLAIMERFAYAGGIAGENKKDRPMFKAQWKRTKSVFGAAKKKEQSKYLCLTYADITSFYMSYSIADILWHGRNVKSLYERALEIDGEFSAAMLNLGNWCYYAPGMFGGGKKKAAGWYRKAVDCARNDGEKFSAAIMLSQVLFELEEFEEAAEWVECASELCPKSKLVATIREQNAEGISLNEYNKKKSSLLREADSYKKKEGWD